MNSISSSASETPDTMSGRLFPELSGNDAAALSGIVDGLLASRLRELSLPPEILSLYNARSSRRTRAMMASWCLWIAAMDSVLAMFDFFIVARPALWVVLATRACIIMSFLTSNQLLRRRQLMGREQLAIILPAMAAMVCVAVAGAAVGERILQLDYLVTAVLMLATGIIFLDLPLRHARLLTIMATIFINMLALTLHPLNFAIRLQLSCLFSGTMVLLFQARKIMILYQHRLFLLNLRDEIASAETANLNAQLSSIAYIDRLTDIPNRRYFDEICASMSETTKNLLPLSICMIDIDHFKLLNDSLGHLQGDHCLRVIASTIRHNLRGKTDILVRYGGEEFLLLLPGTDIDRAADIAERVRAAIAGLQHHNPGSAYGVITASIGITMVNAHPVNIDMLIESADMALYRAKSAGRNRVSV